MTDKTKIILVRKEKYKKLLESGLQLTSNINKEHTNTIDIFATIDTITDFANTLHQECEPQDIDSMQQAIIDINILKSNTESLSVTLEKDECQDFSEKLYTQKLTQMVFLSSGKFNWKILGEQVAPMINTIKRCDCLYKTFESVPVLTQNIAKKRSARPVKHYEPLVKAKLMDSIIGEKTIINEYDSIHRQIMQYCKQAEFGTMPLYKLTIDPHDFARTVEINLAVAFILRSNTLAIQLGADGNPEISISNDTTLTGVNKNSAALSIKPSKWKELIKFYKITEPMIRLSIDY